MDANQIRNSKIGQAVYPVYNEMMGPASVPMDVMLGMAPGTIGNLVSKAGQNAPALLERLSAIMSGLGPASLQANEPVYSQFGEPVEPSYRTIMDEKTGGLKQIRIDPEAVYPPSGTVDTVQWAADNPPPPDQRLPEKNTTTVEKADTIMQALGDNPPPLPSRKPKKKKQVELLPWLR